MAFNAVKKSEAFTPPVEIAAPVNDAAAAPTPDGARLRRRYDLATALGVVREMETSSVRGAVFDEIKAKNPVYRLVDRFYTLAGSRFFQPALIFLYMLKCAISLGPFEDDEAEAVSISHFGNEHHTISRVAALVPDVAILRLTLDRRNLLNPAQLRFALKMLGALPRIWSFLRILARTHSFMPSARIASGLAFYLRFAWLFDERSGLKSAIIPSNYSPESVGLAAAAHQAGRHVIYANHANVPANAAVVPPVYADCALFYGERNTQTYAERSACSAEVAYIGQPATSHAMEWRDEVNTVGIFLTAGTKVDVLKSLIATIRVDLPQARILIRQHPVLLLKTDFSSLELDDDNVELTIGNPLDEEIAACDMVICGNSGVVLNVLSGGRPVAYLASLDSVGFDANGFVASRLAYSMPWWSEDVYERLKAFYQTPGWQGVMQSYDAAYGADMDVLREQAAQTLMAHMRPDCPPSVETPVRQADALVA